MKILSIVCSPRKMGNTEILTNEALSGAREQGAETELISVRGKNLQPCDGCFSCQKQEKCHIQDDMNFFHEKMLEADGIILASPVYFWTVTAQAKLIMDRSLCLRYPFLKLANKVGGSITVSGRHGCFNVYTLFTLFFAGNHMIPTDLMVDGFAEDKGAVRKDGYAMKGAYELGRLITSIVDRRNNYPEEYRSAFYRHVKEKYGVKSCPTDMYDGVTSEALPP